MTDAPKITPPSRTYTAGDKEIRMCHGLMCDFQRMVPDATSAASFILSDPFTRDYLVRRALTDSRKSIEKEEDLIAHELIELDTDEILALIDWIAEHLLYFFVRSAENFSNLASRMEIPKADETPPAPPSEAGSPD